MSNEETGGRRNGRSREKAQAEWWRRYVEGVERKYADFSLFLFLFHLFPFFLPPPSFLCCLPAGLFLLLLLLTLLLILLVKMYGGCSCRGLRVRG